MIDTVLFDMGGTLEDIFIDDASKKASAEGVLRILAAHGHPLSLDIPAAIQAFADGWDRYAAYRGPTNRELKPEEIWGNYVLTELGLDFDTVKPFSEELAHMWEVTHYHRALRPKVKEMLEGLKGLGMKLGVISNTAALYQVFRTLEEYGIRDYFQDVTLSSVTGYRKPDPNIFLVSLNQVRSDPKTYLPHPFLPDPIPGRRRSQGRPGYLYHPGHLRGIHHLEGPGGLKGGRICIRSIISILTLPTWSAP